MTLYYKKVRIRRTRRNYYRRRLRRRSACLKNTPTPAESLLHGLEQTAGGIGFYGNSDKTDYICLYQEGDISTLIGGSLKLKDKFTYLGSSISFTESEINMHLVKAWTAVDRLLIIRMSNLSNKIKYNFFKEEVVSILLYGCSTWTHSKPY